MLLLGHKMTIFFYLQFFGGGNIKTATCCPRTNISFERMGPYMETFVYSKYKKLLLALCILFCSLFMQMRFW